jgi:hypothetical protein
VGYAQYGACCRKEKHLGFERTPRGRIQTFDVQSSGHTYAYAINGAGVITGSYLVNGKQFHGFVGSPKSGFTSFDPPNSTETHALSINDSGVIAGYYSDKENNTRGFIRTP